MKKIDPLIQQPEPITLILPVVEHLLKKNNIKTTRDEIIKRFYAKSLRIAIISGTEDHPAHIYDEALIKIW